VRSERQQARAEAAEAELAEWRTSIATEALIARAEAAEKALRIIAHGEVTFDDMRFLARAYFAAKEQGE
jgi:hypothetical protein